LAYLKMPMLSPMEEEQLDELERDVAEGNIRDTTARGSVDYTDLPADTVPRAGGGTNKGRLRKRVALAAATAKQGSYQLQQENFRIFFHVLTQGKCFKAGWYELLRYAAISQI
jgi:hypothetical protein